MCVVVLYDLILTSSIKCHAGIILNEQKTLNKSICIVRRSSYAVHFYIYAFGIFCTPSSKIIFADLDFLAFRTKNLAKFITI